MGRAVRGLRTERCEINIKRAACAGYAMASSAFVAETIVKPAQAALVLKAAFRVRA